MPHVSLQQHEHHDRGDDRMPKLQCAIEVCISCHSDDGQYKQQLDKIAAQEVHHASHQLLIVTNALSTYLSNLSKRCIISSASHLDIV